MKFFLPAIIALGFAAPLWAAATNLGSEVVVVYNTRLPESQEVAYYYAQKRQVPTNQIFGFELSTTEDMSRAEFRDSLQRPLAQAIDKAGLWRIASRTVLATSNQPARVDWLPAQSKIRYLVLCYGVPLRVSPDPNLKEAGTEELRPEMRRNEAAVDSELALLPSIEQRLVTAGPLRNPVYAATNQAMFHPTNGVILVGRLDGPSAAVARGLVDKAIEAESNGLWGRGYFDARGATEPGYKLGDNYIRNAAEIWRHLGCDTALDEKPETFPVGFPMSQIAYYLGWYDGAVSGPFTRPIVEFMPGAFAYHLHSFSAASVRTATQYWVGPLLAKGATATMGCVYEPYLSGTPDVSVFTARFIYNGFSFGEAACACQQVLSWQTTVVGDPLYRPAAKNAEVLHDELQRQDSPLLDWSYVRLLNLNLVMGKPITNCIDMLDQLGRTKRSAVLAEKLGDLYSAQGKPFSAVRQYELTLKLDPTPMQRLRLLQELGDKLPLTDRAADAFTTYETILKDYGDYND
jgi:uncharacterized protein (TIGR03790 family)